MAPPTKPADPEMTTQGYSSYGTPQVNIGGAAAVAPVSSQPIAVAGYILRLVAAVLALVAAIVMGTAQQTKSGGVVDSNGNVLIATVKFKAIGGPEFQYFVAANVIAVAYSAVSLAMSVVTSKGGSSRAFLAFALGVGDLVVLSLLFSAGGAAAAVALLARNGDGDWVSKVCDDFGKYCGQLSAAITLSMFAALAYLVLSLLSLLAFRKASSL